MTRHGQRRELDEQGRREEQGGRGESSWAEDSGFEQRSRHGHGEYESMREPLEDFSQRRGGPREAWRGRGQATGSAWGPEQELGQGPYRGNRGSWEGEARGAYMDRQRDYRQGEFGGDPYRERGFSGASEQGDRYGPGRGGREQSRHRQGGEWSEQGRYGPSGMGQGWGPSGREQGWGEGEFGGFGRGSGTTGHGGEYGQGGMGQYGSGRYGHGGESSAGRYGQSGFAGYGEFPHGPFAGRGPKGYRRSDDRIKEDVCEQLTLHPDIDASEVEVKVQSGEVTLTGTVDSRFAKRMVEDVVESASGVKDVNNQLRVKQRDGTGSVSDGAGTMETPGGRSRT